MYLLLLKTDYIRAMSMTGLRSYFEAGGSLHREVYRKKSMVQVTESYRLLLESHRYEECDLRKFSIDDWGLSIPTGTVN